VPSWYLLHPAWVHFPIAMLSVGLGAALWREARGRPEWLEEAANWLLWFGAAAAWVGVALGQLAEETAPHVPSAWRTLNTHEALAYWSAGLFSVLSAWRIAMRRGWVPRTKGWRSLFVAAWIVAWGVLLVTAFHGGELVFTHGMGVRRPD